MDIMKKHTDTVVILSAFAGCILWMNSQFTNIDHKFSDLEKDLAVIKAVLVIKNIMPNELAKNEG